MNPLRLYQFIILKNPIAILGSLSILCEWKTAWLMLNRKKIKEGEISKRNMPNSPPPLMEVIHWIAGLGSFLRRKGDGTPGLITF